MSLLGIVVFLFGLMASQSISAFVRTLKWQSEAAAICWAFAAQYGVCFLLLVFLDHAPIDKAMGGACSLIVFVRLFYFLKKLKKDE